MLSQEEYNEYCTRFKIVWRLLSEMSYPSEVVISKICELRGYDKDGHIPKELNNVGFLYLKPDLYDMSKVLKLDSSGDLGLFNAGKFILVNRFIFPVKDMLGNIIALIGWFPDEKKYITTPSRLFSKKCLFFGMDQLSRTGISKNYFLVEGIFDSISIRSLGFNCVALMGISASKYTEVLYSLFKSLVAIPDNDKEGRRVVLEDKWKLPSNGKYLRWKGSIKDIDDLLKYYDMKDVFNNVWYESERVVTVDI